MVDRVDFANVRSARGARTPYSERSSSNPTAVKPRRLLHHLRRALALPRLASSGAGPWGVFRTSLHLGRLAEGPGGPGTGRVLGRTLHVPDVTSLLFLFEEVFLERDYAVDLGNDHPRILDCGANIGMATLWFALRWPGARIEAFEPNPEAVAALRRTLEDNGLASRVTLHPVAVGRSEGRASLAADAERGASLTASLAPGRGEGTNRHQVEVRRLSDFVGEGVDLLKLDVEGLELEVLDELRTAGALERIRHIVCEIHHDPERRPRIVRDVTGLLTDAGFVLERRAVRPSGATPAVAHDVLVAAHRMTRGPSSA
jgi:FkbM family methyltransferase